MYASPATIGWPVFESRAELSFATQIETTAALIGQRLRVHPRFVYLYVSAVLEEGLIFDGGRLLIRIKASPDEDAARVQAELEELVDAEVPGAVKSWMHQAAVVTTEVVTPTVTETAELASSTGSSIMGAVPKLTLLVAAVVVLVFLVKFK